MRFRLGFGVKRTQSRGILAAKLLRSRQGSCEGILTISDSRPFEARNYLTTPEDRAAYLEALLDEGDYRLIAPGLGELARAMGASELSRQTGVSRETIYKSFVFGGNPTLESISKVAMALGLQLTVRSRPSVKPKPKGTSREARVASRR